VKTFVVTGKEVGLRLDECLYKIGFAPSRSQAKALITKKAALVNGKACKPAYIVCLSDIISCEETTKEILMPILPITALKVVYEDDDILIVDKPRGLVVHPANGHHGDTLVDLLLASGRRLYEAAGEGRPGIVHRIDKDTTGLLCVAKTESAFASLSNQLRDHSMHREYLALVKGLIPEKSGMIDAPIGRDEKHPMRFSVRPDAGKEAITYFEVRKRYAEKATLVSCRLSTGRTHQIRVHLDYIGHPVVGDPLYGQGNRVLFDGGQLLHAFRLTLKHPMTGEEVSFETPLPDDFEAVLRGLHEFLD